MNRVNTEEVKAAKFYEEKADLSNQSQLLPTASSGSERQPTGLKRCPFCGAIPKLIEQPTEVHFYVMCIECGACGSDLHGRQDAITAWNTRAIPPDSEDVEAACDTITETAERSERSAES